MSWRCGVAGTCRGRACLRAASRSRMPLAGAGSGVRRHGAGAARRLDPGRRERRRNRLGPAEDDALARLRTGAAASLVLLTATALGLASCPVTEPLEIADARAAVREEVFGGNEFPQMPLRVGWAPINADPLQPTASCLE